MREGHKPDLACEGHAWGEGVGGHLVRGFSHGIGLHSGSKALHLFKQQRGHRIPSCVLRADSPLAYCRYWGVGR